MNPLLHSSLRGTALATGLLSLLLGPALAEDQKGPFKRLFSKKSSEVAVSEVNAPMVSESAEGEEKLGIDRFPSVVEAEPRITREEVEVEAVIDAIYSEYEEKVSNLKAADLQLRSLGSLPDVRSQFSAPWASGLRSGIFGDSSKVRQDLVQVYSRALQYSNAVKVFSDLPLIRETAIQEAEGDYDWRPFIQSQFKHGDEPTTSTLTTGETGTDARLIEDLGQLDYGVKKKVRSGGELTLSNRLNTLKSNSSFLTPNPQTGSELVLGFVQPFGRGAGYAYNRARIKIAKLDAGTASAEYLRALETHLIEVNRSYWEVYLSRAAYLQKRLLMDETSKLVNQLEERAGVDEEATRSELLRARSQVSQVKASLIRGEMAIRNAEERLRALVNDPDFAMGSGGEFIPLTRPVLSKPSSDVRETALAALYNRPEVVQGFYQLRAAGVRRDVQRNEVKPQLNVFGEVKLAGLDEGRSIGDPFHGQFEHGTGLSIGGSYQGSLERNTEISRVRRAEYEFRQQANQLRAIIDQVLLESVVSYRELMTAYRDMQGRYQAVLASREEVRELKERLDVDSDDERTVGYQLQLILDAIERNQAAEERFLVSLISYNTAFATVERSKGTLLSYYDVDVRRFREETWEREKNSVRKYRLALDSLNAGMGDFTPDLPGSIQVDEQVEWERHRQALDRLKRERGL